MQRTLRLKTLGGTAPLEGLARRWNDAGIPLCWLDSAQGMPGRARFSVLAQTRETVVARGRSLRRSPGEPNVVELLRDRFRRQRDRHAESEAPDCFLGGLVGYVAYEAQIDFDPAFPDRPGQLPYPRLCFRRAEAGVTVDHAAGATHLWAWVDEDRPGPDFAIWEADLRSSEEAAPAHAWRLDPDRFPAARYRENVRDILERIVAGEVYQVNLTEPLAVDAGSDPLAVYLRLRRASPGDYAAFLRWPGLAVLASSPEQFLTIRGHIATSRPMKGTRRRSGEDEGSAAADELRASEKDRAENLMIVDLIRNDLGRVAAVGSVEVPALFHVEQYATVWQLTSTVTARLAAGEDAFSALAALFPPGSMTGAPKVQATRIIRQLEPMPRGLYSGCLGAIDWRGDASFNVVIRTLVGHPRGWSVGVGGGIVADSVPEAELAEALTKLSGVARALV